MGKSIRLSNSVRDEIISRLINEAFDKKFEDIDSERYALSLKVYNDVFSKKERDAMYELPDGWLPTVSEMKVQFGGDSCGVCRREFKEPVRVPAKYTESYGRIYKVYPDNHAFTKLHDSITSDFDSLKQLKNKAIAQAKAVLYSCNTTKALKEAWPEIENLVCEYEPSEESENKTAIVPVANGLNQILGLAA